MIRIRCHRLHASARKVLRSRTCRAIHFPDVAFADHCIEDRGGTAVADPEMTLKQRCRPALRIYHTFQSVPEQRISPARKITAVIQVFL